jgi:hypothetical protein
MGQAGADTFAEDLAFELGEHCEQSGHCAARGAGQIERFGQPYKSHVEMLKLLERRDQVRDGPAPAIQTPHQDDIAFAPACGGDQSCAQLTFGSAGANFFDLRDDAPSAPGSVFAHGVSCNGNVC